MGDAAGQDCWLLRLSLPDRAFVAAHADELPTMPDEAMIREVHVYGMAARVGDQARRRSTMDWDVCSWSVRAR